MAFDEKGNKYFDPSVDPEDAEALADVDRLDEARAYKHQQGMENQFQKDFLEDTLKGIEGVGISKEEMQQLIGEDYETTRILRRKIAGQFAKELKQSVRKRDPKTGEFVSGPSQRQVLPQAAGQSERVARVQEIRKDHDEGKEGGRHRKFGDKLADDMLEALIPNDDPFLS